MMQQPRLHPMRRREHACLRTHPLPTTPVDLCCTLCAIKDDEQTPYLEQLLDPRLPACTQGLSCISPLRCGPLRATGFVPATNCCTPASCC
ncbi:hypothetical protein CC79DRAFT_1335384 [Sarocladium strictum]